MTPTRDTESTVDGRFARTAVLALVSSGLGSTVFENVDDALLSAPFFVLMALATAALAHEVRTQARRRSADGAARWEGTDTAIVGVLIGLAVVSSVALAVRSFTAPEQSAGLGFAALFVVLAGLFGWNRRATLQAARASGG